MMVSCARSSPLPAESQPSESSLLSRVAENHAEGVYQSWLAVHLAAVELDLAVQELVEGPSEATLSRAREAWTAGRALYGPTEVFRFQGGPIDGPEGPEGLINAWPLDEAYIDYSIDVPTSGIIQDVVTWGEITPELLVELNERDGEENIATGWHAIEFLLWGQDLDPQGPGSRPHTDYSMGGGALNADRRAAYLQVTTALLVSHIEPLVQAWEPDQTDNYRARFVADPEAALGSILTGMGMLAGDELAGERIAVAWETRDPEDEQSCFSDTTHLDIIGNASGIQQAWMGTLAGSEGPGPAVWLESLSPEAALAMKDSLTQMMAAVEAIPAPFDQAIQAPDDSPERAAVEQAIEALEAQAAATVTASEVLGLRINLEGG
jgi:putative iron-regulated protein